MLTRERIALLFLAFLGFKFVEIKVTESLAEEPPVNAVPAPHKVKEAPEAVPGQYLVRLKEPLGRMSAAGVNEIEERTRGTVLRIHSHLDFLVIQKPVIQNHHSALADIVRSGLVKVAEPNFIYRAVRLPNDADFPLLWGLKNTGQPDDAKVLGKPGIDVDAERAWDITVGSDQITVAVIDTGIDYDHPDINANMWENSAEAKGTPGVDDDGNGLVDDIYGANFADPSVATGDPKDDNDHGTHCAGTVAARGDNQIGVAGVSWKSKLMAVKFLDQDGAGTLENAIKAIDYAVESGAKILSNSWSGGGYSQILYDAIAASHKAGVLFVAAASNSADNNDVTPAYPASYDLPNVVSVAAIDHQGQLTSFSNYGRKSVHLAAPGKDVLSATKGGTYQKLSGTSMAAPHVSGVAALVWGENPNLSALEVKDRLMAGSRPLAALRKKTVSGGLVNAYYALTGRKAPEDADDPYWWKKQAAQISTPHPYGAKDSLEYEVQVPGAKQIALYFERFEVENFFDYVYLITGDGQVVGKMTDVNDDDFSPVIEGDYVKIVLRSDESIEKYGFDLTAVAYR